MTSPLCPDCEARPGQVHDDGCDVARCGITGGQRLTCEHPTGDCRTVWTGVWPIVEEEMGRVRSAHVSAARLTAPPHWSHPKEPPWPGEHEPVSLTFPDTRDPLDKWEQPDGYWSDELTAMVAECQAGTRSVIPCPVCGRESTGVTVDTVSLESMLESPASVRYPRSGRVYTFDPCGHALKR